MQTELSWKILTRYIKNTPSQHSIKLSKLYNSNIFLKREDLQKGRSFKIRGSLNKCLKIKYTTKQVVCPSAGNHAQGVAFSCNMLNMYCKIFLPKTTPIQKIEKIKYYGKDNIDVVVYGNNFHESLQEAIHYSEKNNHTLIHPYDDLDVIEGQSTIGYEIDKFLKPDYVIVPVGGGGLISGIGSYLKNTKIIGVESENTNSLQLSLKNKKITTIENIDTFVDGVSVNRIGKKPFDLCKQFMTERDIIVLKNSEICKTMIDFHNDEGIILEPAGALTIAALKYLPKEDIKNKKIVCIVSGGNMDAYRWKSVIEKIN